MARPLGMNGDEPDNIAGLRVVATSAGSIVADNTTLSDANYPLTNNASTGGIVRCGRMKTIRLNVEHADGSALPGGTSIVVEPLVLDSLAVVNRRWKRLLDGSGNPVSVTLDGSGFMELRVDGRMVFLRVATVTGAIIKNIAILGFPGEFYVS